MAARGKKGSRSKSGNKGRKIRDSSHEASASAKKKKKKSPKGKKHQAKPGQFFQDRKAKNAEPIEAYGLAEGSIDGSGSSLQKQSLTAAAGGATFDPLGLAAQSKPSGGLFSGKTTAKEAPSQPFAQAANRGFPVPPTQQQQK